MKNEKITHRSENFASWYTDIVKSAHLADYSGVKGFVVLEPNGYAIWESIQRILDGMFKKTNHENVYMPALIPEGLLKKEGELVKGFAPEVAWVTEGGSKKLDERLAFRPTSESLFCDYYKTKISSYRDLPKLYNQWCSVIRWEKETRPFLRHREFLWQEGHTVHSNAKEAIEETDRMLNIYKKFFEEYAAIPVICGRKSETEKFAGAEYTLTVESMMQNGVCLQSATSHYFGQKFAKAYDVKFINKNNEYEYAYQTSWGLSTRSIGALIMVHSDDYGLVLPPFLAPKQVVIIPISMDEEILSISKEIKDKLDKNGITSYIDFSDKTAGYKFAEAEVNGIPLRIEIGKRDLENNNITIVRRDTRIKEQFNINDDIVTHITSLFKTIQNDMYNRALKFNKELTSRVNNYNEFVKAIMNNKPGFIHGLWCGSEECELKAKETRGAKIRCIMESKDHYEGKCVICGKEAKHDVIWGIQY